MNIDINPVLDRILDVLKGMDGVAYVDKTPNIIDVCFVECATAGQINKVLKQLNECLLLTRTICTNANSVSIIVYYNK